MSPASAFLAKVLPGRWLPSGRDPGAITLAVSICANRFSYADFPGPLRPTCLKPVCG
jgi:hypothetical protein